ncbi:hypothetical protein BC936DRAFT_140283 [Jimgerdemannia flammicorona]|uniref:Uncharacterized protein n=1 Tax=Jimgerdemannia flammicorona TaxID=994334 RepID=A0A433AVP1_9FUNG|nr:hypothetical protein BC936DRAFT_140283 [Jimgerdemannia flammicorona]
MGSFERGFREENPVIRDNANRIAVDMSEAYMVIRIFQQLNNRLIRTGHQRGAIQFLELCESAPVNNARNDILDIERLAQIVPNNTAQLRGWIKWFFGFADRHL